jgi:signal transduction histidine kinase
MVSDTGPGVPPADRERVLARFVRLEASRSTPGTGLGLTLVKAIADLHNARLELSDNSPGLRVTITFAHPAPTAK